jgi:phage anti-repressor protein
VQPLSSCPICRFALTVDQIATSVAAGIDIDFFKKEMISAGPDFQRRYDVLQEANRKLVLKANGLIKAFEQGKQLNQYFVHIEEGQKLVKQIGPTMKLHQYFVELEASLKTEYFSSC